MQAARSLGLAPQGRPAARLCARSSSFLALQHQRLSPVGLGAATVRRRCAVRVAASAAQPLLRAAAPLGRLAVRALPANLLAAAFAAARSGRMNPWIMAGLLVYCVGVTIYATNTRRQVELATASAAGTIDAADTSASLASTTTSLTSASLASVDVADASGQTQAAGEDKKKERSEVCKVCGGTGQVSYENHMQAYDGTVCPCCLGKGRVKRYQGNLISALLSFDP
ncbi:hypothetical protein COHA_007275 [Chlorella ohadii]|uniref:Uncharacterized protein n=1 Tax=Chlorella ohadii TaxID=2649997 RepID=A0AAD5H3L7_9CHLO|nr:hypothetical protein COHA_007275 [Chlorella ohadii]